MKLNKKGSRYYLDNLVDVIDGMVERTPDYEERVRKEDGLNA